MYRTLWISWCFCTMLVISPVTLQKYATFIRNDFLHIPITYLQSHQRSHKHRAKAPRNTQCPVHFCIYLKKLLANLSHILPRYQAVYAVIFSLSHKIWSFVQQKLKITEGWRRTGGLRTGGKKTKGHKRGGFATDSSQAPWCPANLTVTIYIYKKKTIFRV